MENLRTGIGLHAYGQRDPLVMYRTEGHKAFQELLRRMQVDVVHSLFHVTVAQQPANGARPGAGRRIRPRPARCRRSSATGRQAATGGAKIGRNAPLPLQQRQEIQALLRRQRLGRAAQPRHPAKPGKITVRRQPL